jgi:hypothetical protein
MGVDATTDARVSRPHAQQVHPPNNWVVVEKRKKEKNHATSAKRETST